MKTFKLKMPNTAVLLIFIILFMAILTYIIPAGQFERVVDETSGRTIVQAGTYTQIESSPTTVTQLFSSVYKGLLKASDIIAFLLIIGGSFGIITKTQSITVGLQKLVKTFQGKESVLIFILMLAFAVCGTTFGMSAEAIPLVAIVVAAVKKMGYDDVVGVSIVVVGIYCGYSSGVLNPFNTGIAQEIAGLPLFSGMLLRLVFFALSLLIAFVHTVKYAKKNKLSTDNNVSTPDDVNTERKLNKTDVFILLLLFASIIALIIGVIFFKWYLEEIAALFLAMGLIGGMVFYKGNFTAVIVEFLNGCKDMSTVIMYVGLSRAVLVVLEDAMIMDTIVYYISMPLSHMHNVFSAIGIYFSQGLLNFFIPSSTGQAVVIMPIIVSISDIVGITRQTSVLAFQAGDGFWNMITPTHSMLMAALGVACVPFTKWFKFALGLVIKWSIMVCAFLAFATVINWGPF